MMRYVDPSFQERLDGFNAAQGGPSYIVVAWDAQKNRWRTWVVPTADSIAPGARNRVTSNLLQPIPDGSGRMAVKLNLWQGAGDEYLPLDERYFDSLRWADSFRNKQHFEETVERPEFRQKAAQDARLRDIAYGARSYWWAMDRLAINPNVKASGDWRWRTR